MLTPKVGMSVWYYPGTREGNLNDGDGPLASIVCDVHNNASVNLSVLAKNGVWLPRHLVPVVHPSSDVAVGDYVGYCTLPDFEDEKSDPIDAEFEVDNSLRDFFLRTVEALISQDRHDRTPLECAQKAWMVTDYVRSCLADLK